jgi:hypothetical protein
MQWSSVSSSMLLLLPTLHGTYLVTPALPHGSVWLGVNEEYDGSFLMSGMMFDLMFDLMDGSFLFFVWLEGQG